MKFKITVENMKKALDKMSKVTSYSKLVDKHVTLLVTPSGLTMFGNYLNMYGEITVPCIVDTPGTVVVGTDQLSFMSVLQSGYMTFEMVGTDLTYNGTLIKNGRLSTVNTEPGTPYPKPDSWKSMEKLAFDAMWAAVPLDIRFGNVIFDGSTIVSGSGTYFSGYRGTEVFTETPASVQVGFFNTISKEEPKVAFIDTFIWMTDGELYVRTPMVWEALKGLVELGYYEKPLESYVEYSIADVLSICDITNAVCENKVLIFDSIVSTADGTHTFDVKPMSSSGQVRFALSALTLKQSVQHNDGATVKMYPTEEKNGNAVIIIGNKLRHTLQQSYVISGNVDKAEKV